MTKKILIEKSVTVRCCACAGQVTFEEPGEEADSRPTFLHTMPYCSRFDQTNTVDDIIKYMRDCVDAQNKEKN